MVSLRIAAPRKSPHLAIHATSLQCLPLLMTPRHRQFMALLSFDRCQQFFLSSAQIRSSPLRCKVLRYPSSLLATGKVRKSDLRTWASHPQAGRAHLITMCCCLLQSDYPYFMGVDIYSYLKILLEPSTWSEERQTCFPLLHSSLDMHNADENESSKQLTRCFKNVVRVKRLNRWEWKRRRGWV